MRDVKKRFPDEDQVPKIPNYLDIINGMIVKIRPNANDDHPITKEEATQIQIEINRCFTPYNKWFLDRGRCPICWGYGDCGGNPGAFFDGLCDECNGTGSGEIVLRKKKLKSFE